jgi:eukaryotic-like serine/threonine-protein kinase
MSTTTIAGRYQLDRRLGAGGMSTVHLALDSRLERYVAIKLLAEHLADDPTFVSRFQREAQAAARLVHPNIVQVFDSGLDETSDRHYIVMEYIHGHSGAELLREYGHLHVDDALPIITQACQGLDYAHRHGVVHRDVKPGNLLRAEDGAVKLADFGIAKATEQSSITQVGSVLGTAAYLAPEQARGEEAGPAADLYALGVVTYQLMSGRLPYEANSLSELALKQQSEHPAALDELNPDVGHELALAVARALALDPAARYGGAEEMADALEAGHRGIPPARPVGVADPTSATRVLTGATDVTRAAPRAERRPATTPLRPRPGPPPRRTRPVEPVARQRRSGGGGRALLAFLIIAAILVGGVVVLASSSTTGSNHGPNLSRQVIYSHVQQAVNALQQFIDDNTR